MFGSALLRTVVDRALRNAPIAVIGNLELAILQLFYESKAGAVRQAQIT
jgi:hypothetical protein